MKSIKISIAVLVGSVMAHYPAHAQQNKSNFIGWEMGVGVAAQSNTLDYQGFLTANTKSHDTVPFGQARYGWSLDAASRWIIALGGQYDFSKAGYGSTTYTSGGTQSVTSKYSNGFSVFIEPGYIASPNWLVYGKFSLKKSRGEFSDTGAGSGTTHHSGHGFGLGLATQLGNQWIGRFEITDTLYSREQGNQSTGKPKSTAASISVGYKF